MAQEHILQAKHLIAQADAIMITAGAGMGVDSGLPDFRGTEGFWKAYPPLKKLGLNFSDIANPKWFDTKPSLAWAFYGHRLHLYNITIPHEGFALLHTLVQEKGKNYFIVTSNVDGQFQKAGFDEKKILEVHGSIHHLQCSEDCQGRIWDTKPQDIMIDTKNFQALTLPMCPDCKAVARPNIMMFGDWSFNHARKIQQEENYQRWLKGVKRRKEKMVIIELGAGLEIPTIQKLGNKLANNHLNCTLIRINPRDFSISPHCGVSLNMGALMGLDTLLNTHQ